MKIAVKAAAVVLLAVVTAGGGYIAGQRVQLNSQVSAMPKETHVKTAASALPETTPDQDEKVPGTRFIEEVSADIRKVKKTDASGAEASWTKVEHASAGDLGTVILYTSAQKEDGELIWDDGQKWLVEIDDGNGGYYTLYDRYVNNGSVYFDVVERESGEKIIDVYTMSSSGTTIMQYTYSEGEFQEKTVYNSGSVNRLSSTVPIYR